MLRVDRLRTNSTGRSLYKPEDRVDSRHPGSSRLDPGSGGSAASCSDILSERPWAHAFGAVGLGIEVMLRASRGACASFDFSHTLCFTSHRRLKGEWLDLRLVSALTAPRCDDVHDGSLFVEPEVQLSLRLGKQEPADHAAVSDDIDLREIGRDTEKFLRLCPARPGRALALCRGAHATTLQCDRSDAARALR